MITQLKFSFYVFLYGAGLICFIYFINLYELYQYFIYHKIGLKPILSDSYDYIVVGSGTGGSTVALRLSEDSHTTVLLIEAGSYGNFLYDIPALGPLLQQTNIDWSYHTERQNHSCLGLNNHESIWPMGRIFGGTSRLNNMIYLKGHRKDYDLWYKDKPNYNYKVDILPFLKKAENQRGIYTSSFYHSMDGLMDVDDLPYVSPLADAILKAAKILGYQTSDINGLYYTGFMIPQVNIRDGKRRTISDVIFETNRPNLHVITQSEVYRINFDDNNVAYSLNFMCYGISESIEANKGIILSAGVIGTPKLLMLSGIGPKNHLESLDIKVKKDLPVGLNLQDHITTGLDLIVLNNTLPVNVPDMLSFHSIYNYFMDGTGPWTSVGCEVIGIPKPYSFRAQPDLQFMVLPLGVTTDGGKKLRFNVNIKKNIWDSYFKPLIGQQVISFLPILLHPKSKGYVQLRSKNHQDPPIINPNYLTEKRDVDTLIEGIKIIGDFIRTEPMQKLGANFYHKILSQCRNHLFDTKGYWECYIRHLTFTSYHPGGTCKMGNEKDNTSVVDYNFKVIGTKNLYIADASIMPSLPSGNINGPIAVIGEKLAHILKTNVCDEKKLKKPDLYPVLGTCDSRL